MKKYLYGALALPLLFACSSDDLLEKEVISNDRFAGIEKVDATFIMNGNESGRTRMATDWALENGDVYGFAWLGGGGGTVPLTINGEAYQNHPLKQVTEDGKTIFKPETSIYVGKYFLYRPYDYSVVDIDKIHFNSLVNQDMKDGMGGDAWAALAKNAIIIGDKFTNVTKTGTTVAGKTWDKAGIKQSYNLYAAFFSNQTGLDLTYQKNNVEFSGSKKIAGATDIDFTPAAGTKVGAADIYKAEVTLAGAAQSFTYAPTTEANAGTQSGQFWADQSNVAAKGFTFNAGAITLNAPETGISTDKANNKGWFWFNSLPVDAGNATSATAVTTVLETSYGIVTLNETLGSVGYVYEKPSPTAAEEWMKIAAADNLTKTPKEWQPEAAGHNTFVNQYGNHVGKYAITVDFSKGNMNGMHIKNDAHLQKALKYYIASGKTDAGVILNLDQASAADNTFKISKLSIALLQTINAGGANNVKVQACTTHGTPKVIVTQDGQGEWGLAAATEVPDLNDVFAVPTDVFLASGTNWTWKERTAPAANVVTVDANVKSLTNEGNLTVNASNIQLSTAAPLANAKGATMTLTTTTTVKNALTNLGTINVPAGTELRAYDVEIKNDATSLTDYGVINNAGVVGVTYATTGTVNNYGKIIMESSDAITLLTSNQTAAGNFDNAFNAATNKLGTVVLPAGQPNALVSVSNGAETGFIEYTWTGSTTYATPNGGIVKYNTLIVSDNIAFTTAETEIRFIKFEGVKKTVTNSAIGNLPNLKGIIIKDNCSIIIEKSNVISCSEGSHLGNGAAVYNGGTFNPGNTSIVGKTVTDYLGTWNTDQVVVW